MRKLPCGGYGPVSLTACMCNILGRMVSEGRLIFPAVCVGLSNTKVEMIL